MFAILSKLRSAKHAHVSNQMKDAVARDLSTILACVQRVFVKRISRPNIGINFEREVGLRKFCQLSQSNCGYSSVYGRNKSNEDRCSCIKLNSNINYFAVFDGHCGDFASNTINREFPRILTEEIAELELTTVQDFEEHGEEMLTNVFKKCQIYLKKAIQAQDISLKSKESLGSTALIALIVNDSKLLLAHVGDSRAILCTDGKPQCLTEDHTPDNEAEVNRILESGGWIDWDTKMIPYVNGLLSMTRSLGNLALEKSGVTNEPYVFQSNLNHEANEFLILCSDGISNWMTDEDMIALVSQCETVQESADTLTACAQQFGSNDDATAVVIKLGAWDKSKLSKSASKTWLLRATVSKRY